MRSPAAGIWGVGQLLRRLPSFHGPAVVQCSRCVITSHAAWTETIDRGPIFYPIYHPPYAEADCGEGIQQHMMTFGS